MTDEENYGFDVGGFLIIRSVLTLSEIQACNDAIDSGALAELSDVGEISESIAILRDHPRMAGYLDELTFDGYHPDGRPQLVGTSEGTSLSGGNEPRDHSRDYTHQNDVRFAQGVIAIWALADVVDGEGGYVFVPASHRSYVETPADLVQDDDDTGLVRQLQMNAGDLFICVENVLHGVRPWKSASKRLVAITFASEHAQRFGKQKNPPPEWLDELTPEQKAVVAPDGRPDSPPLLETDGQTVTLREDSGGFHPSIYIRNPNSGIDEKEFYHWDLCGYLVLRGVMDAEWLDAANAAVEQCSDRIEVGGDAAKGSKVLAGTGVPSLRGLFELPAPYSDPFRKMLAHPAVVHRLNWMMGSGFRLGSARAICSVEGTSGHGLHSGSDPVTPVRSYALQNGRTYCESINVAWQLRDVTEADGGFVCIPGSHKARYPVTPSIIACEDTVDLVQHVAMQAGDVALFMGAAQTHGAYPWRSDVDRRVILIGYTSRNIVY
ncbi:MAG: phytanoyl-CoA dioxygenase family protein [Candidatus Latescibacterota bacterium]|nr:phytanoyl-CoA dioxygenase family protein [Candidatus Latescibacterota bacterium]